ncbi:MAG: transcriptional regulator [Rhizobium sp.]|nr:MAG: transcriptional regulator [Rhizobium sp.]
MVEKADAATINLTAGIVAAYVENNTIAVGDLPALIKSVHAALNGVGSPEAAPVESVPKATAAQIRKSITPDALISFEDGKPYRTLKRHLTTMGLTVEEYKAKWGLPKDYPTVAPSYSEQRSAMAKSLGLGKGGRGGNRKVEAPKPAKAKK